ncbi:MAG: endonuclease MutS2 [candidate division Zixibacteria bacterium]|nr:endonuclease MutS2 [candidate division Zixibacteria bacterium]
MIDQHTIEKLEFPKIIRLIAGKCITPYGSDEVYQFVPLFDKERIDRRQSEISQMKDIINFGSAFPLSRMEDCRELLVKSLIEGVHLQPESILQILELIEVSIDIHDYNKEQRDNFPAINEYLTKVRAFPELKKEIQRAIDEDGNIRDNASPKLKHIRQDLSSAKSKIISRLQHILSAQPKHSGWQDDIITQRNGRYVIPLLANQYKSEFGILHDRSQSGATVFVEPQETVELNNKLNMLFQEERVEMDRILRALTGEIARRAKALQENTRLIGKLDSFYAAAQFARQIKAERPIIKGQARFDLKKARHPLLIVQFTDINEVIPLNISLGGNSRQAILVTGPNTGGKTIALKTIGLMVLMAQSGLPIPADEKTEIGVFNKIYADIGDEQSIELSLSTFSSHIKNIIRSMKDVSDDTLILFDEIGAGTDPKEGAALAESIILYLLEKKARIIATTHYSQLKTLPLDNPEIENASLEFNRETLTPTFNLQLGIPGSSYAVEIATRLGLPRPIGGHAAELLGKSERSLTELISSLETELAKVREDRTELTERLEKARELETYYRAQTEKLKEELETQKKEALTEIENFVIHTRSETERLVSEIRKTQADKKVTKAFHKNVQDAQHKIGRLRKKLESGIKNIDYSRFCKGDRVRIISLNQNGEIDDIIEKNRARVRVNNMTTVVELRNLEKLDPTSESTPQKSDGKITAETSMSPEIHLRGMTAEEAMESLEKFLDRAVLANLSQIYVIHGKGTGVLRKSLTEYLKNHPDVESLRLGNWNEGGAGVTVVKLKE